MKTKKKITKELLIAACIAANLSFPAYASSKVTSVTVSVNEDKSETGTVRNAEVSCNNTAYEIDEIETSKEYDDWYPGRKITYDITITPTDGYYFSKGDTKVNCSSNADIAGTPSVSKNKITMKLNYRPTIKLSTPENIYFEDEYTAKWDKVPYAEKYEIKIIKDDEADQTVTVNTNKIDLSNYATDFEDITFDIRAIADDDKSKYITSSDWVNCDEDVSASKNTVYGNFTGGYQDYRFKIEDNIYASGWQFINGKWFYFDAENNNKAVCDGWKLINNLWYHFDLKCEMQTGWIQLNGYWYYLGPDGDMKTGWYNVGPSGKWYYLDVTSGALWTSTTTPDGHIVNSDGEMIV